VHLSVTTLTEVIGAILSSVIVTSFSLEKKGMKQNKSRIKLALGTRQQNKPKKGDESSNLYTSQINIAANAEVRFLCSM